MGSDPAPGTSLCPLSSSIYKFPFKNRSPHRFEVGDTGLLGSPVDSPEKPGINRTEFQRPACAVGRETSPSERVDGEFDEGDRVPLPEGYKAPTSMGEPMDVSAGNSAETGSQQTAPTTIPFRPETAPFHGGVKLAELRGFPGVYERISGNGDAPSGALAPILRIRLCGPVCTTKPSAQSLLFLCAREPGQQRCRRSRDPFAAGRRSDLPGKKCGLQRASCSTHCNNQNGLYFRVGE